MSKQPIAQLHEDENIDEALHVLSSLPSRTQPNNNEFQPRQKTPSRGRKRKRIQDDPAFDDEDDEDFTPSSKEAKRDDDDYDDEEEEIEPPRPHPNVGLPNNQQQIDPDDTVPSIISRLQHAVQLIAAKLEMNKDNQKKILFAYHHGQATVQNLQALEASYAEIDAKIRESMELNDSLHRTKILTLPELATYHDLVQTFVVLKKQYDLLYAEIRNALDPNFERRYAKLVICKHSFPQTVRQNKPVAGGQPIVVRLLADATAEFSSISIVSATLIVKGERHKRKGMSAAENQPKNNTANVDLHTGTAEFPLVFVQGTRMSKSCVKFSMEVQVKQPIGRLPLTKTIKTTSKPFIVITNESQWEESEGTLVQVSVFGDPPRPTAEWPLVCNVLQRHLMQEVKIADPGRAPRALSKQDFDYFHVNFFGRRNVITHSEFVKFWDWYGKAFQVLRFQKHISTLWQLGLFYGFMTRATAVNVLKDQPVGTFILIFSEKFSGQMAIAYKSPQTGTVKHYLIGHYDTGAKKPLPAFLFEHPPLTHILQFTMEYNENNEPIFVRVPKDEALNKFAPSPPPPKAVQGDNEYDPVIA